jgi:23S rRNA-/tRNA-specific pseudouridylate synthase
MLENDTPILGDPIYNKGEKNLKGKGLFLCATKLEFRHPKTHRELNIEIPHPNKFNYVLKRGY